MTAFVLYTVCAEVMTLHVTIE